MTTAANDYRLVVFDAPPAPEALRDLLCGVLGLHPTEAMHWVARTPGIWSRPLAEGETRELLDGMFDLGVAAEAWRVDQLPKLTPARSVHVAACLPDGLRIGGLRGEPAHWIPWNRIELIHAAQIAPDSGHRAASPPGWVQSLTTGLNAMVLRKPPSPRTQRAHRTPRDPVPEVHLVRSEPRVAFRISADQFNYAYLAERLRPSSLENFPLLLRDLAEHARSAYLTESTRALLAQDPDDGPPPEPAVFPSSQAMLDDTTLRLIWAWYRRDRDRALEDGTEAG